MEESTLKNIDAHIFALRNKIVALKVDRKISEEERQKQITDLRESIAKKESFYQNVLLKDRSCFTHSKKTSIHQ